MSRERERGRERLSSDIGLITASAWSKAAATQQRCFAPKNLLIHNRQRVLALKLTAVPIGKILLTLYRNTLTLTYWKLPPPALCIVVWALLVIFHTSYIYLVIDAYTWG